MSSTEYVLTDFNNPVEPIRWVLAHAGANWKENPISFQSPIPLDIKARLKFGQLPMLEFEGKRLVQSTTITRYLAKQFNLAGKDDFEAAQVDEAVDTTWDIFTQFFPLFKEEDPDKKAVILQEATTACKTKFLSTLEKVVEENGGNLVGSGLTFADIVFTTYLYQIKTHFGADLLEGFPALTALSEKTNNSPGIKEWMSKRSDTQ